LNRSHGALRWGPVTISVDVVPDFLSHVSAWGTAAAAVGTLFAVGAALWDSRQANKRAVAAENATEELRQQQDRERDDREAAAWAHRSATRVTAHPALREPLAPDYFGRIGVRVANHSDLPVHNVVVRLDQPLPGGAGTDRNGRLIAEWDKVTAMAAEFAVTAPMYLGPDESAAQQPKVTVLFDDAFGNRWRLAPDGSLLLSKPRRLGVDDSPIDEAELRGFPSIYN
jgi:hypothetical protein